MKPLDAQYRVICLFNHGKTKYFLIFLDISYWTSLNNFMFNFKTHCIYLNIITDVKHLITQNIYINLYSIQGFVFPAVGIRLRDIRLCWSVGLYVKICYKKIPQIVCDDVWCIWSWYLQQLWQWWWQWPQWYWLQQWQESSPGIQGNVSLLNAAPINTLINSFIRLFIHSFLSFFLSLRHLPFCEEQVLQRGLRCWFNLLHRVRES